jgi:hypothetical protein
MDLLSMHSPRFTSTEVYRFVCEIFKAPQPLQASQDSEVTLQEFKVELLYIMVLPVFTHFRSCEVYLYLIGAAGLELI